MSAEQTSTTYYGLAPDARRVLQTFLTLAIVLALLCLLGTWLTGNAWLLWAGGLIALVSAPFCVAAVRQLRKIRMGIGVNGLKLQGVLGDEEIELAWPGIERIHLDTRHHGLVLCEPLEHAFLQSMVRANRVRFSDASESEQVHVDLVTQQRWIPFERFSGWLDQEKVLGEIQFYAPHLAANRDVIAQVLAKARKRNRRFLFGLRALGVLLVSILLVSIFSSFKTASSGQSLSWLPPIHAIPLIAVNLLIISMVPLLGYYAISNVASAIREFKTRDLRAAFICVCLAVVQIGFAIWIGTALIYVKRG